MYALMQKRPVLHAVAWILIYLVLFNVGEGIAEATGFAYATAALVLALAIVMVIYLVRGKQMRATGFKRIGNSDLKATLYYAPLALLAVIQLFAGVDPTVTGAQIAGIVLLMIGVGFVEAVTMRGLLYQGIAKQSGMWRAILITGVTFGLGHIVNLLRGYDMAELSAQIVVAVAIGIVLALLVAVTGNIVPGILFHVLFNITGSIANTESATMMILLAVILVVCVLYGWVLIRQLSRARLTPNRARS